MRYNASELPSEEDLYRLYVTEQKSTPRIAEELAIPITRVRTALERYGIPMRSIGESTRLSYLQQRRRTGARKGVENAAWKGGRRTTSQGYVEVHRPNHPAARRNGYIFEHRLVWEEHNGPLPPGWHIHHVNGDKQNNHISNLRGMPSKAHACYIADQQRKIRALEEENALLKQQVVEMEQRLAEYRLTIAP